MPELTELEFEYNWDFDLAMIPMLNKLQKFKFSNERLRVTSDSELLEHLINLKSFVLSW